jgi:hypothetical protein
MARFPHRALCLIKTAKAEKLTTAISAYLYTDKPGSDSSGDRPAKRFVRD